MAAQKRNDGYHETLSRWFDKVQLILHGLYVREDLSGIFYQSFVELSQRIQQRIFLAAAAGSPKAQPFGIPKERR